MAVKTCETVDIYVYVYQFFLEVQQTGVFSNNPIADKDMALLRHVTVLS